MIQFKFCKCTQNKYKQGKILWMYVKENVRLPNISFICCKGGSNLQCSSMYIHHVSMILHSVIHNIAFLMIQKLIIK